MKITNCSKNTVLAHSARIAETLRDRLVGLLDRQSLQAGEALVITRCNSIHMFFMKFAIDAVFIDANNRVVGLVENIKPYRLSPIFFKARQVIELPAGTIEASRTDILDIIEIK